MYSAIVGLHNSSPTGAADAHRIAVCESLGLVDKISLNSHPTYL